MQLHNSSKSCDCQNTQVWSGHLKTLRLPSQIGFEGEETEGKTDRQTHWETDGWIRDRIANREDRMTSWLIWVTSQLMQISTKQHFLENYQNNHDDKQETRMERRCRNLSPSHRLCFSCVPLKNGVELLQLWVLCYLPGSLQELLNLFKNCSVLLLHEVKSMSCPYIILASPGECVVC